MHLSKWIVIEATANTIIGTILAVSVLLVFGVPLGDSLVINAIMIGLSFVRSYILRLFFRRIYG